MVFRRFGPLNLMDMYRLFARGYLGPNSTLADVHVVNAKDASAVGNSLATSDSCPTFKDVSGGEYVDEWDSIYLPPIVKRLNRLIDGNLTLDASDLSLFPYLCGFESQITRRVSAFCGVFRPDEILQYEYRQDLRYYYGTGKKSGFHMP
jgi:acid phosphatase